MTWNPLSSLSRKIYLTQRPTPAPPLFSRAEDRDLDIAVQRLMHVETTIRKLSKEMKKYLEAVANLDRADQRLSYNLTTCGLVHISDEFRKIVEEYYSVTMEVGQSVQSMINVCQKTFIEPLKKLREEFGIIATALAKREELVVIWKNAHSRVTKLQERRDKTATHIVKLEKERKAEEAAAKDLKMLHDQLLIELPLFLDKRLEYLKPSVHALIMIHLDHYGTTTEVFTQLMPEDILDKPQSTMPEEEYQELVNHQFTKIKGLAIVKHC